MTPREAFALVVRTVGLLLTLVAVGLIYSGSLSLLLGGPANMTALLAYGIPEFVAGIWLLRGAPDLVSFAFGGEGLGSDSSRPSGDA